PRSRGGPGGDAGADEAGRRGARRQCRGGEGGRGRGRGGPGGGPRQRRRQVRGGRGRGLRPALVREPGGGAAARPALTADQRNGFGAACGLILTRGAPSWAHGASRRARRAARRREVSIRSMNRTPSRWSV